MLGLSILFFLLAVGAGILGFSGIAGTLTSVAVIAFYAFILFLIVSLIAQAFGDVGRRGGLVGAVIVVALIGGGIYWWTHAHDQAGFDRNIKAATSDATGVFKTTDAKAKQVVGDVAQDAKQAINDHKNDQPDSSNR